MRIYLKNGAILWVAEEEAKQLLKNMSTYPEGMATVKGLFQEFKTAEVLTPESTVPTTLKNVVVKFSEITIIAEET